MGGGSNRATNETGRIRPQLRQRFAQPRPIRLVGPDDLPFPTERDRRTVPSSGRRLDSATFTGTFFGVWMPLIRDQDSLNLNAHDLIATARGLTESRPRRPTQANLRRAVSTAYYAVFHSLARTAADLLIGRNRNAAWYQVYRALEHGNAKNACRNKRILQGFPPAIQDFADTFVALQDARHEADYAFEGWYNYVDTLAAIDRAENAIGQLGQTDIQHRRGFVVHVLFKRRSS